MLLNRIWAHSGFMPLTLSAVIRSYLCSRKNPGTRGAEIFKFLTFSFLVPPTHLPVPATLSDALRCHGDGQKGL